MVVLPPPMRFRTCWSLAWTSRLNPSLMLAYRHPFYHLDCCTPAYRQGETVAQLATCWGLAWTSRLSPCLVLAYRTPFLYSPGLLHACTRRCCYGLLLQLLRPCLGVAMLPSGGYPEGGVPGNVRHFGCGTPGDLACWRLRRARPPNQAASELVPPIETDK